MSTYARLYRQEIRELNSPLYRLFLRFALTFAAIADRWPRLTSWSLLALALWGAIYIFFNYHFTTAI